MLKAAQEGNTDRVQDLINEGYDVNAKGLGGDIPLRRAATNGHQETVRVLLDNGADVDAKGALHGAAMYGHQATVRLLLDNGAQVDAKDNFGKTALDYAKSDAMREIFASHQQQPEAAAKKKAEAEAAATKKKAEDDAAAAKKKADAKMLRAVQQGNTNMVRALIRQGADVNAMGSGGKTTKYRGGVTALHWAAFHGHEATAQLLLDNGAQVDAEDDDGETPLDYAQSDAMREIFLTPASHQQQPDTAAKKKAEDDAKKTEDDAKKTQNTAQLTQQVATLTKTVQQQEKALADKDKVIADRDAEVRRLKQALRAAKKNSTSVPLDPNCCVCKLLPTKIAEVEDAVGELSVENWNGADGDPVGDGGSCTVVRVESVNWPKDKPRCKRHSTSLVAKVFKTDQKESVIKKEITTLMTIGEHRNVPLVGIHETQVRIAGKKKKEITLLLKEAECNLWQFAQRQIGGQASQLISTLLGEAARALADFHKRDLLHRDIKPHNFLVGSTDPDAPSIWLSDFGMVKGEAMSDFSSTKTGVLSQKGTWGYLPPEGMQNNLGTQAADVYAFGVTMWEAFVGKRVLPESVNTIIGYWTWVDTVDLGALAAELQAVPNVPKEICEATMTCLAKNPETRPTMASLVEVFETVLE